MSWTNLNLAHRFYFILLARYGYLTICDARVVVTRWQQTLRTESLWKQKTVPNFFSCHLKVWFRVNDFRIWVGKEKLGQVTMLVVLQVLG